MQEERKRDVEETADFIKQIINTGKSEQQKELSKVGGDIERLRRDLADKSAVSEFLDFKSKLYASLEGKVSLKEVQGALNEC